MPEDVHGHVRATRSLRYNAEEVTAPIPWPLGLDVHCAQHCRFGSRQDVLSGHSGTCGQWHSTPAWYAARRALGGAVEQVSMTVDQGELERVAVPESAIQQKHR